MKAVAKSRRVGRTKLSTTVAPDNYAFLERQVKSGAAANLADALDRSIAKVRQLENRSRLARATAQYFDQMNPEHAREEEALGRDMASAGTSVDFDHEL